MSTDANAPNVVIVQQGNPLSNHPMASRQEQSSYAPANIPKSVVKFFQGEPEVLGVTQLIIGINHIFFAIILTNFCHRGYCYFLHFLVDSGVLFWAGIMYVTSGSLSIAASYKPSLGKVNASLVLNILSCILAVISVIIFVRAFTAFSSYRYFFNSIYCAYYKPSQTCEVETMEETLYLGIISTLFILTVLELCIALSTSIFGCRTVCRTSYNDVAVVIYQTTTVNEPKTALSSDGEVKTH